MPLFNYKTRSKVLGIPWDSAKSTCTDCGCDAAENPCALVGTLLGELFAANACNMSFAVLAAYIGTNTINITKLAGYRYVLTGCGDNGLPQIGCLVDDLVQVNGAQDDQQFVISPGNNVWGRQAFSGMYGSNAVGENLQGCKIVGGSVDPTLRGHRTCFDVTEMVKNGSNIFRIWVDGQGTPFPGPGSNQGNPNGNTSIFLWEVIEADYLKLCGGCKPCCKQDGSCDIENAGVCAGKHGTPLDGDCSGCDGLDCGSACCHNVDTNSAYCTMERVTDCIAGGGTPHVGSNCCEVACACGGCVDTPVQLGLANFAANGFIKGQCVPIGTGSILVIPGTGMIDNACLATAALTPCNQGPCKIGTIITKEWLNNTSCLGIPSLVVEGDFDVSTVISGGIAFWSITDNGQEIASGTFASITACHNCNGAEYQSVSCTNDGFEQYFDCTKVILNA
jgi:hypothetical protein